MLERAAEDVRYTGDSQDSFTEGRKWTEDDRLSVGWVKFQMSLGKSVVGICIPEFGTE